jgi:hypothetical protein
MAAIYTLFSSLFLIVFLFAFKHWELRSGKHIFQKHRERADIFITDHIPHIQRRTVETSREVSHKALMSGLHYVTASLLVGVRAVEKRLSHVVDMIRGKHEVKNNGNASDFLIKVRKHRKISSKNPTGPKEHSV